MTMLAEINPVRARLLRIETSMTWREIAALMSVEADRVPPFSTQGVQQSVRRLYGTLIVPGAPRKSGPVAQP